MKKIGIIGGLSPESTAKYYQWLHQGVRKRLGQRHSAKVVLTSVDWDEFCVLKEREDWDMIGQRLAEEAQALERAGVDFVILATNTMHKVADRIESAISVPFLHLADATAAHIKRSGIKKVGLLGTRFTMEMDFYKERLAAQGISCVVPESEEDREAISKVIYTELCYGESTDESRKIYSDIMCRLVDEQGAEGIVLGCTEITLLVTPECCTVPLFDTTRIHVEAALDYLLADDVEISDVSADLCAA